jgi:LemA protein
MVPWVVVGLLVVAALWYVGTRNSLVRLEEGIDGSWSEIDNQLQRRADLIPNLVATVKGFAGQEQQVLGQIAEARARMAGAGTVAEKAEGYNQLQSALSRLLVVVENYPELKSNQNFIRLQDELAGTENRIAVARKRYNDDVRIYNTRIRQFPASTVAGGMGLDKRDYFEIDESARTVPQVSF